MTGLESLNMRKMQAISRRKIVIDIFLMIVLLSEFSLVAVSKEQDGLKTICEIFLPTYFTMILCDAIAMITSYNKRNFIL